MALFIVLSIVKPLSYPIFFLSFYLSAALLSMTRKAFKMGLIHNFQPFSFRSDRGKEITDGTAKKTIIIVTGATINYSLS
ncbi:hypothetical protein A0U42_06265 [Megasphaera sp. DISK 18]|nr:hypothetical protein A0U42_06265 [Megasphaera sp. DISK 18]